MTDEVGGLPARRRAGVIVYDTPDNLVDLLDRVVGAAAGTRFYSSIMPGVERMRSLEEFRRLPVTPIASYRAQPLGDVVADPARVHWIAGRYQGQRRDRVAVAEGPSETAARYAVVRDALKGALPDGRDRVGAVVASSRRRYFAAEISTILAYMGVPTHVFVNDASPRLYEQLRDVAPDVLAVLTDDVDEAALPPGIELCVTVRSPNRLTRFRQLDLYLVDELGFLGHSPDLIRWIIYNDQYLFEVSDSRRLILTALHNRTQPMIRIETRDVAARLSGHHLELERLSEDG